MIDPINGPIMNPVVKNPVNVAMFLTRVFPLLTFEIIASHGGQKNACATPVSTLQPIISGTDCEIESRYTDIEFIPIPNNSINDNWRSPYTKNSIDYVLSTTKNNLNQWISVKANVKDHFKKLHNLEIDKLDGVALMTDTDQTNIKAISYYQNIYFSSE